jgi:hypothetical protein
VGAAGRLGQAGGDLHRAERVQFLGTRDLAQGDGRTAPESDVPADAAECESAAAGSGFADDDDLPFWLSALTASDGAPSSPAAHSARRQSPTPRAARPLRPAEAGPRA